MRQTGPRFEVASVQQSIEEEQQQQTFILLLFFLHYTSLFVFTLTLFSVSKSFPIIFGGSYTPPT